MTFRIIQGGMGVGVSGWRLARAVAAAGQLGVVSGTGLAGVLARRLQSGDAGGHLRAALAAFPLPGVAERILRRYFLPGGRPAGAAFVSVPMPQWDEPAAATELTLAANFVEVHLAKAGHGGPVGINYLEKVQLPHLPSLYGAMLAGVDYVLMGAGIPRAIPGVLDAFAAGRPAAYRLDVDGAAPGEEYAATFDPAAWFARAGLSPPPLRRPRFFAIISSAVLAATLARKANGRVDGFVVEGATAGGHNAPPRGPLTLTPRGEPVYGPRDEADLGKLRDLGLPFYLAGGYGRPGKLAEALAAGASGVQVGTAFAFCEESGLTADVKGRAIAASRAGTADVFTDPAASPTGFPLKVLSAAGTLSEPAVYAARERVCDLGYLRRPYRRDAGGLGYRCPAEPAGEYVAKGGTAAETDGRKCLCNALFANIGLGQRRPAGDELPLVTAGEDARRVHTFVPAGGSTYRAADVLERLLADVP